MNGKGRYIGAKWECQVCMGSNHVCGEFLSQTELVLEGKLEKLQCCVYDYFMRGDGQAEMVRYPFQQPAYVSGMMRRRGK